MSGDTNLIFYIRKAAVVTTLIALLTLLAIGQSTDVTRLRDATQQLSASLEALDWAKSETLCLEIIELKSRIYGADSAQSGRSLIDLSRIQRQSGKFIEARQNLEKAVAIIEKFGAAAAADLVTGYSAIGYDFFYDRKPKDAEAYYLKALNIADRVFGLKSMESYLPAINLANLYLGEGKYEKANEFYIRSYRSAMTHFKSDAKEVRHALELRRCADLGGLFSEKQQKAFWDVVNEFSSSPPDVSTVVNGKALSLPKPEYPREAAIRKLSGKVSVEVLINEKGDVEKAKAICGAPSVLAQVAVSAAKKAKFTPTYLSGLPVKVTGIITYNFVP